MKKAIFLLTLLILILLRLQTVSAHPYQFYDGFETGDFNLWDSTQNSSGETSTVQTSVTHHGSYGAKFSCDGSGSQEYSYAMIDNAGPYDPCYVRMYLKITGTLPASGSFVSSPNLRNGTAYGTAVALVEAYSSGASNWNWRMGYRNGSADWLYKTTTSQIQNDTWYCVELGVDFNNPQSSWAKMWIDGSLEAQALNLNFTGQGSGVETIQVGERLAYNCQFVHSVYVDCVAIDDEYIGPASLSPTVGSISSSVSNPKPNINFQVSATINDEDGIADLKNCTLTFYDGYDKNFSLKWIGATNTFSEDSDPSNWCTLQSGTRTTVNATAYTLAWTLLIRETYPELPVNVDAEVHDDYGTSGTDTSSALFRFTHPPGGIIGYVPVTGENQSSGQTPDLGEPSTPQAGTLETASPYILGVAVCLIVVGALSTTSRTKNLKASRNEWKSKRKKKPKSEWKEKKQKKQKWNERQGAFD